MTPANAKLKRIDAVGVTVALALGTGAWFAFGQPVRSAWAEAEARQAELGAVDAAASRAEADAASAAEAVAEAERLASTASTSARPVTELNARLAEIVRAAETAGLTPGGVSTDTPVADGAALRVPISINGLGGYRELTAFLAALFADHRDTTVERAAIRRGGDTTSFEIELVWWAAGREAGAR